MEPWETELWLEALGEFLEALALSATVGVVSALVGAILGLLVAVLAMWLRSRPLPSFRRAGFAALCGTVVGGITTIMIWIPVLVFRNTFGHPRAEFISGGADLFVLCLIAWMIGISGSLAFVITLAGSLKSQRCKDGSKPMVGETIRLPNRWWQFSLRALLAAVLLISVGLAMVGIRTQQLRPGRGPVEKWERIGARPSYDHGDLVKLQFRAQSKVTDAALGQLRGLTDLHTLYLSHTNITDAQLEHLEGLANLRKLRLEGTHVTEEGVKKLREALPDCNIRR